MQLQFKGFWSVGYSCNCSQCCLWLELVYSEFLFPMNCNTVNVYNNVLTSNQRLHFSWKKSTTCLSVLLTANGAQIIVSWSLGKCIGIVCRLSNGVLSIIEMDFAYCNGSHTQTVSLLFQEAWRNVVVAAFWVVHSLLSGCFSEWKAPSAVTYPTSAN